MKKPLLGTVYGEIFLSEDVGLTGPRTDSPSFGTVKVDAVDLRTAKTSTGAWSSGMLDPNRYIFLGLYDINGTGDSPTPGTPVTLPVTNKFDIVAGQSVDLVAIFELIYN